MEDGWIGVDLDGTLARYDGWNGPTHIGEPIPPMLSLVKEWIASGKTVKIVTARVCSSQTIRDCLDAREAIKDWSKKHIGKILPVTAEKDYGMIELWDDRCVPIVTNTGEIRRF